LRLVERDISVDSAAMTVPSCSASWATASIAISFRAVIAAS